MIEEMVNSLLAYPVLVSFIVPFFFGGGAIIILGILSGQGKIPFLIAIVFSALAVALMDYIWFSIGRIKSLSKLKRVKTLHRTYTKAKEFIEEIKDEVILLTMAKLTYGLGVPTMIYLGRMGMPVKRFFRYNLTIIAIWTLVIAGSSWLVGRTYIIAADTLKSIYHGIAILVTGLLIIHLLLRYIRKRVLKNLEKIKKHESV
jgi:membrane protein DedA with SNARE-associated domain